jgi:hypothetical protein
MNKKELQQTLIEIDSRLKAFGDLNELIVKAQSLPSVLSDAELKKTNIESFLNDLPTRSEELNRLTKEVKGLNEELASQKNDVSSSVEKIKELSQKVEALVEETRVQLGKAANEKLANSFEIVSSGLVKEKEAWYNRLVKSVLALIVASIIIVAWQVHEAKTLYELSFLIKVTLTSPFVYFVIFINREYSRTRSLIEEYIFKTSIARSFEAYKEIVESTDSEDLKKTLDFILDTTKDLYSSPMVNIKNNSQPEKENAPDILGPAKDLLDKLPT